MKTKITPDEFFELFGKMFAGMQAPASMGILGAAREPWGELRGKLQLMGWNEADECEQAAREVFGDLAINTDLLEACKAAAEVWDSDSTSMDPEDVHAMLVDAAMRAQLSPAERLASLSAAYNVILLAVALLEDGAPNTALDRLRKFSDECETLEMEKEKS